MKQVDSLQKRTTQPTTTPVTKSMSQLIAVRSQQAVQLVNSPHRHQSFLRKWGSLLVLSLALAIIIIDTTILNVALRNIIADLHTDIQSVQWVITIYALTLAAFTITGGRIGDLYGRKKMFMLGAFLFATGSFVASISHSVEVLLAGESIIEGIGAALMMPATASLLLASFHGRERAISFAIWGAIAGAASALGPILGGWLTTTYSWRWAFRINVFVAAVLIIGAIVLVRESVDTVEKHRLDIIGVILSALGLFSLVFGIIESSTYGWWRAKDTFHIGGFTLDLHGLSITPPAISIGLILLILFGLWQRHVEKHGRTPLVSLKIFLNRQFSSGTMTTAFTALSMTGLIFALPIFFQAVQGKDAFQTGLSFLPLSIAVFVTSPLSLGLSKFLKPKWIIQFGILAEAIAMLLIRQGMAVDAHMLILTFGMALFGVGLGLVQSQINNLTLSAVSVQQGGEASGVNNTLRQVGSSFGSAIIGAVLLASLATNLVKGVGASQVIPEVAKSRISDAISRESSAVEFGDGPKISSIGKLPSGQVQVMQQEIGLIAKQATVDSVKTSLSWGILFVIMSFLVSFWLPSFRQIHTANSEGKNK